MKLRHIFATLIACLAIFASCSEDQTLDALDIIQVSKSLISIPAAGGSETVNVTAKGDWKFMTKDKNGNLVDELPSWLTISPASGEAGETEITFSAEETTKNNSSVLYLTCNGQNQWITVIQQAGKVEAPLTTCANVIAGADGETYRVKGTVTKIANTTYGNWYLNDGTGEVYIYGTLDANGGAKNFASLGIEVGDIVTVQGPKKTYGSTIELIDVEVVEIEKSLIKVEGITGDNLTESGTLPKEGGDFTATLTCKGEGVSITVPDDAKSWLSVTSVKPTGDNAYEVSFRAAANEKGNRSTTLTFATTKDGKEYTATSEITQEGAIVECTIADFANAEVGSTIYRITGVITQVKKAEFGNCYIADATGQTYVYGMGAKGEFQEKGLKLGDIVTISGVKDIYNGEGQMKNATIEVIKPVTPVTVEEFLAKEDNDNVYYRLTGKVSNIKSAEFGNYDLVDETGSVYIYGTLAGWGGASKQFNTFGITEGDEISIITIKTSYKGAAQGKNAILFKEKVD